VGQNTKDSCFGPTPSRPSGPGVEGGNEMQGIKSNPPRVENIKKGTKSIVLWLFLNCQIALQTIPMGS